MMGIGFFEVIIILLVYPIAAIITAVVIGIGIALGFRWGSKWLLKAIYSNPEFENWLKQIINSAEKPNQ